ncbi:50S ribosomal protein L14 [Candidatus Parvarchaeota archaeon]|nr:50S ribosomal protein L14 [Candidatus Parvarchaeota archaeon]
MKGLTATVTKGLTTGTVMQCIDNSGAKIISIIGAKTYRGKRALYPKVGVGDIVTVSVKKGTPTMRKKVVKAVIVRQKKEYRRPNGTRIQFEDNAAVLIDDQGLPVGTEIKGVVAREVAERFPKVAAVAAAVM